MGIKVGDKVRIHPECEPGLNYEGLTLLGGMVFKGTKVVRETGNYIKLKDSELSYAPSMLQKVEGESKIFRVYKKNNERQDVYLRLQEKHTGVTLQAVNRQGYVLTNILRIGEDGIITIYNNLSDGIGITKDSRGRVVIEHM